MCDVCKHGHIEEEKYGGKRSHNFVQRVNMAVSSHGGLRFNSCVCVYAGVCVCVWGGVRWVNMPLIAVKRLVTSLSLFTSPATECLLPQRQARSRGDTFQVRTVFQKNHLHSSYTESTTTTKKNTFIC